MAIAAAVTLLAVHVPAQRLGEPPATAPAATGPIEVPTVHAAAAAVETTTTTDRPTEPRVSRSEPPTTIAPPPEPAGRDVASTAYCLTGTMADGVRVHQGAIAGNLWPLGTVLEVSDGPYGPGRYIVEDRIGYGSQLDFAMPGDCGGALTWGRRRVQVTVAGTES